jgi:hypothetical protein
VDAYVFIREADEGAVAGLAGKAYGEVRYVAPITGAYLALAVVTVDGLPELEKLVLERFREAGVRATETAVPVLHGPNQIKWEPEAAVEAFVRIWVERGRAEEVLGAASNLSGALGAAVCAADFDILLELGGGSFEDVAGTLLNELHQLPGVVRTATSLAVGGR